jgi:hypothetical protein
VGKLLVLLVTVVVIAAIAGLMYRPATVIGVSEKSLASSMRAAADADKTGACNERADDKFSCTLFDPDAEGSAAFDVEVGDYGCWDATSAGGGDGARPQTLSGCITIVDLARGND